MPVRIPTFFSVGEPHVEYQKQYLKTLIAYLSEQGVEAETLGRSFWSIESPLIPIQKKMEEVYGAAILAMERFHCFKGAYKEGTGHERGVDDLFYPTVWTQIEAAMAYQLRLPLLIMKEEKLLSEGMMDPGIHEWVVIRINPEDPDEIKKDPIVSLIESWVEAVRRYYYKSVG